jgi:AbrB family looped-hinge helix DNA binding protein
MDIESVRLGERGQVVIPQDFRRELKLKCGEKMLAVLVDNKIVLEPVRSLKAEVLEDIREDMIDLKICSKFWDDVKANRGIVRQSKGEFLRDLETW